MKCPECGTYCEVLETRTTATKGVYRRYQCANRHRFSTRELVVSPTTKPENKLDKE